MNDKSIPLTYLNIRQSIAILLAKLTMIDFLAAFLILLTYFLLLQGNLFIKDPLNNPLIFVITFGILGLLKVTLTSYIVLQWLNEYYEITPNEVVHKSGIIFKKKEKYDLEKVRAMSVHDDILGELFNYATVTLYDLRLQKYLDMYLIHNPKRYTKIFETLRPNIEFKTEETVIPMISKGGE